jgi:hypothetical protein
VFVAGAVLFGPALPIVFLKLGGLSNFFFGNTLDTSQTKSGVWCGAVSGGSGANACGMWGDAHFFGWREEELVVILTLKR